MSKFTLAVIVGSFFFGLGGVEANAAIVTDVTPDGLTGVTGANSSDFLGVVTTVGTASSGVAGTATVNTSPSSTVNVDALSGSIAVNDVIGRDLSGTGFNFTGANLWSYNISLPGNAQSGTGLSNIQFDANVFLSSGTFETADDLTFELFLNGQVSASDLVTFEATGGASSVSLIPISNIPSGLVNSASIVVSINNSTAFETGTESFAVNSATLQAGYSAAAVPEPSSLAALIAIGLLGLVRRRRAAQTIESSVTSNQ